MEEEEEETDEEEQQERTRPIKKETFKDAQLVNVPTAFEEGVRLENGDVVKISEVIVKVYNDVQKLKKGLL